MEIEYDRHALLRMGKRRIRDVHVQYVLENGRFTGRSGDGKAERLEAVVLGRRIRVMVEWRPGDRAYVRTVID